MVSKRMIKAKDIVADMRFGMTDSELMEKYRLSAKGLHSIFKKLEAIKALRPSELYGRQPSYDDTVDVDQVRREQREYLQFLLPVHEAEDPQSEGIVTEISKTGLRVKGIRAQVNEVRSLVVRPEQFFHIDPFGFQATCRWTHREGANRDYVAGFEITAIMEEDLEKLRQLIGKLRLAW